MPNANFFETYPLYRKFHENVPSRMDNIPKPRINMDCLVCGERRTFIMTNEYWHGKGYANHPSQGEDAVAKFGCVSFSNFQRWFYIKISDDLQSVFKIGQSPPLVH
jgi:hypothetical protein